MIYITDRPTEISRSTYERVSWMVFIFSNMEEVKETALWDEEIKFDHTHSVYGNKHLFYLNEVRDEEEIYDGSDVGPIIKDEHYEMMLTSNQITVLNKTECGNGGTSGIVDYLKAHGTGGLILVPNVSISKGKEDTYKDDPDICCVYGGKDNIDWTAKIVISTYDQFKRLLANLSEVGVSGELFSNEVWSGRAIFIDEYHKLVDERFRPIMAKVTELIIKTDLPVTLMSATPHMQYIKELQQVVCRTDSERRKKLVKINVVYKNRTELVRNMTLYSMPKRQLKGFIKQLIANGKKVCVFYNNVSAVSDILKKIGTDDCEILCSSDEDNKKECDKYYSESYDYTKKVHFMTSAYFTGHDIYEEVDNIYIIGNGSRVENAISMRDIQQILGRFRKYCGKEMVNVKYDDEGNEVDRTPVKLLLIHMKEKQSKSLKQINTKLSLTNKRLEGYGDNWIANSECIDDKLKNIYCNEALERIDYWSTEDKLVRRLLSEKYLIDEYTCIENHRLKDVKKYQNRYGVAALTAEVKGKQVYVAHPVGELPDYKVEPYMKFNEAFLKVVNGEDIDEYDYPEVDKIRKYIEKYGVTRNRNGNVIVPTKAKVMDTMKIHKTVEGRKNRIPLDEMYNYVRFAAFGFDEGDIYKAKSLKHALEYLQGECPDMLPPVIDYGMIPLHMKDVFGTAMYCKKSDKRDGGRLSDDDWVLMGVRCNKPVTSSEIRQKQYVSPLLYKDPNFGGIRSSDINIGYQSDKRHGKCWGKTTIIGMLDELSPSLTGIEIYDWVNEDRPLRAYLMKAKLNKLIPLLQKTAMKKESGEKISKKHQIYDRILDEISGVSFSEWLSDIKEKQETWEDVKKDNQLKISELYRDTDKEYRHLIAETNMISSIIIDLDSGITFNEFKELYKDWEWIAYPTLNHSDTTNWNKFRVIVPLDHPVDLGFDRNLEILKALRSQFCVYEDRNHGLTSYINKEDWSVRYENDGRRYCIEQSEVEEMRMLIIAGKDKTTKSWEESIVNLNLTTDEVKTKYIQSAVKKINDCKEGERDSKIYGQLRFLAETIGIKSPDVNTLKEGVLESEKKHMIDDIIRRHAEWNL